MVKDAKDSRVMGQKDMIGQLNMMVSNQNERILPLRGKAEALVPHSYASASAAAWVMYQKYANSMPLYRQEQGWKQMGAILLRATLANWIIFCPQNYSSPLYGYFHRELLKRQSLMRDETRAQAV